MKKLTLSILVVILCAGLSGLANANNYPVVSLTFTGHTANGIYGPYTMQVNGGSHVEMVCSSDKNFIAGGQTWLADVLTISQMDGIWGRTIAQWREASFYAALLLADPGNANLQNAVWASVNFGGGFNNVPAYDTHWTGQGMLFYIPDPASTTWPSNAPQPFITTPEPASLLLLGSGLIAGSLRRWRVRL